MFCFAYCIERKAQINGTVLANSLFSPRDINLTLGLLPPRSHVALRDSVGVESSRLELINQSARMFFIRAFSGCYAILTSPKQGETAVYSYNPALFWVLSVSCWCLAELIFTYYDQHCSILLAEFNMSYFWVFNYARAIKQKVWNEAENREWDWGETLVYSCSVSGFSLVLRRWPLNEDSKYKWINY